MRTLFSLASQFIVENQCVLSGYVPHYITYFYYNNETNGGFNFVPFTDSSVSSVGDIPMVTKLGDGDQIENKRGSVGVSGGDQGLVTLIQSGNGVIWDAALRHCYLQPAPDAELCSYTSLCHYIQIMLGETPPFSHPQLSSLKLSSLVHTPWTSQSTPVSSSDFSSVTAGSLTATSINDDQSSFVVEGSSINTATSSLVEPAPTVDDTLSDMQPRKEDVSRERTLIQRQQDTGGHGVEQLGLPGKERRADTTAASQHVTSSSWQDGSDNDPSFNKQASLVRTRESTLDNGISDNPSSAYSTFNIQDHSMHSLSAHDQNIEILEPSIQLETTTVTSPAELMRPTPVLEMSRASVEGDKKASEVRETAMPGVKPSPISSLVDENAGDESVSLYPQTLAPSVEVSLHFVAALEYSSLILAFTHPSCHCLVLSRTFNTLSFHLSGLYLLYCVGGVCVWEYELKSA